MGDERGGVGQINSPLHYIFHGLHYGTVPPSGEIQVPCEHAYQVTFWVSSQVMCGSGAGKGDSKLHHIVVHFSLTHILLFLTALGLGLQNKVLVL